MRVEIHENVLTIKDAVSNKISRIVESKSYVLYPDTGKLLRNKKNNLTTDAFIGVGSKDDISNYEEIDKEVINGQS